MSELILKEDALDCFHDWIDRYGYEHTADEDRTYQLIEALDAVRCCDEDCISRRVVIEAIDDIESEVADGFGFQYEKWRKYFCELPAVQPDHNADVSKKVSISCGQENDLISRQAARHALCKAVHKGEDIPCENQTASCLWTGTRVCDYVREIDALLTVQPETHWIPCSERLPEEGQKCLVYDKAVGFRVDTYIGHGNPFNWELFVRDYEAWIPIPKLTGGDVE